MDGFVIKRIVVPRYSLASLRLDFRANLFEPLETLLRSLPRNQLSYLYPSFFCRHTRRHLFHTKLHLFLLFRVPIRPCLGFFGHGFCSHYWSGYFGQFLYCLFLKQKSLFFLLSLFFLAISRVFLTLLCNFLGLFNHLLL